MPRKGKSHPCSHVPEELPSRLPHVLPHVPHLSHAPQQVTYKVGFSLILYPNPHRCYIPRCRYCCRCRRRSHFTYLSSLGQRSHGLHIPSIALSALRSTRQHVWSTIPPPKACSSLSHHSSSSEATSQLSRALSYLLPRARCSNRARCRGHLPRLRQWADPPPFLCRVRGPCKRPCILLDEAPV